jgi:hypothetical protein
VIKTQSHPILLRVAFSVSDDPVNNFFAKYGSQSLCRLNFVGKPWSFCPYLPQSGSQRAVERSFCLDVAK